jgi:D-alanyl-D-alanine carboxypeptidase
MKKKLLVVSAICLVSLSAGILLFTNKSSAPSTVQPGTLAETDTKDPEQSTPEAPTFNKSAQSLTDPTSIWFIANKHYALPISYVPSDLTELSGVPLRLAASEEQMKIRKVTETQLLQLFADAKSAGLQLEFGSGYRSAAYQKVLYNGYVQSMGQTEADKSSARPGHSEHQTGLALDFTRVDGSCHLEACFGDLAEGKWLAENAYKYGFMLRYPEGKETITGYMYEPWHYRFVGTDLSTELHSKQVQTLEEFFGLAAAADYL